MFLFFRFSLHWDEWTDVGTIEPRSSLPEPERPFHQLHLRGWKFGAHMAARQQSGPEFSAVHQRSDRLCSDIARGYQEDCFAKIANNQGTDVV